MNQNCSQNETEILFSGSESLLMQFIIHEFCKVVEIIFSSGQDFSPEARFSLLEQIPVPLCEKSSAGPLWKLHNYLVCFILKFPHQDNGENIEKLLLQTAKEALHLATSGQKREIVPVLEKMHELLTEKLLQYKEEEGILLFLLRHHLRLDSYFTKPFVAALLEKMFPKGADEAAQYVSKRFLKRGFNHLLPVIWKSLLTIKNESL